MCPSSVVVPVQVKAGATYTKTQVGNGRGGRAPVGRGADGTPHQQPLSTKIKAARTPPPPPPPPPCEPSPPAASRTSSAAGRRLTEKCAAIGGRGGVLASHTPITGAAGGAGGARAVDLAGARRPCARFAPPPPPRHGGCCRLVGRAPHPPHTRFPRAPRFPPPAAVVPYLPAYTNQARPSAVRSGGLNTPGRLHRPVSHVRALFRATPLRCGASGGGGGRQRRGARRVLPAALFRVLVGGQPVRVRYVRTCTGREGVHKGCPLRAFRAKGVGRMQPRRGPCRHRDLCERWQGRWKS